jgi:Tol biopolymer transport system component
MGIGGGRGYLWLWIVNTCASTLIGGCSGYPRLLNFPLDGGGRGLNSLATELTPQMASEYITFVSDRNGSQDVYLYDAKNRRLLNLPGLNALNETASHPSVSEDGRYLVFAGSTQGRTGIYIYDRQTQQKRNLTASIQGEVRNPTISADGNLIAFEVAINGQWDIMLCDRFGKILDLPGTPTP